MHVHRVLAGLAIPQESEREPSIQCLCSQMQWQFYFPEYSVDSSIFFSGSEMDCVFREIV